MMSPVITSRAAPGLVRVNTRTSRSRRLGVGPSRGPAEAAQPKRQGRSRQGQSRQGRSRPSRSRQGRSRGGEGGSRQRRQARERDLTGGDRMFHAVHLHRRGNPRPGGRVPAAAHREGGRAQASRPGTRCRTPGSGDAGPLTAGGFPRLAGPAPGRSAGGRPGTTRSSRRRGGIGPPGPVMAIRRLVIAASAGAPVMSARSFCFSALSSAASVRHCSQPARCACARSESGSVELAVDQGEQPVTEMAHNSPACFSRRGTRPGRGTLAPGSLVACWSAGC